MVSVLASLCFILSIVVIIEGSPVKQKDIDHKRHLMKYGYLPKEGVQTDNDVSDAITLYQEKRGLERTGKMNDETRTTMGASRCGMSDFMSHHNTNPLLNDSAIDTEGFPFTNITYRIESYSGYLSDVEFRLAVSMAFKAYSDISPLVFNYIDRRDKYEYFFLNEYLFNNIGEHITIVCQAYEHKIGYFDGGGYLNHNENVLAVALEAHPGYMHTHVILDGSEHWVTDINKNQHYFPNILRVLMHEIGHTLGLGHNWNRTSIMDGMYQHGTLADIKLDADDIRRIQLLYGTRENPIKPVNYVREEIVTTSRRPRTHEKTTTPPATSTTTTTTTTLKPTTTITTLRPTIPTTTEQHPVAISAAEKLDLCKHAPIEAAMYAPYEYSKHEKYNTYKIGYIFTGNYYFQTYHNKPTRLRRISDYWQDLEGPIDAAVYIPNNRTVFRHSYMFTHGVLYLFKGKLVYGYRKDRKLLAGFPKPINKAFPSKHTSYTKIPDNIDYVFIRNVYYGDSTPQDSALVLSKDDIIYEYVIDVGVVNVTKKANHKLYKKLPSRIGDIATSNTGAEIYTLDNRIFKYTPSNVHTYYDLRLTTTSAKNTLTTRNVLFDCPAAIV